MIVTGTEILHKELGPVRFVVRPSSRHVSARWREGKVVCNVPPMLSREEAVRALESMADSLSRRRPQLMYYEGQTLEFEGWNAVIRRRKTIGGDRIFAYPSTTMTVIELPSDFDFSSPDAMQRISSVLCMAAQSLAPRLLIPRAMEIADRIERRPMMWNISHGHRTLGYCNARGEISLSYMVAFLPARLRDYIICHELAHLSEMNHSRRFHELCDLYCGGEEKLLIEELKHFNWPILK